MSGQVAPLVALRWRMVRSAPARWGFVALASVLPLLAVAAVLVGVSLPDVSTFEVLVLAPTAYLAVAVVAVLAPLVAGGGNVLFPDDQLAAYPVTSRTHFHTSIALTPLNLAWSLQLVGLLGITAYSNQGSPLLVLSLVICLVYVGFVTVAGHALAWLIVGVRQTRRGRQASWAVAAAGVLAGLVVVATGHVAATLERLPTTSIVIAGRRAAQGDWPVWTLAVAALGSLTAFGVRAGRRACDWALRRPGRATRVDTRPLRRRPSRTPRATVLSVDRASVWRSASLRRGLLVLAVIPGLAAAVAGLDWPSLVLLPALVAAGSGLLFGVNAFCLDGSGAVWLASLPGHDRVGFWCKTQVLGEVAGVAIALTLVAGSFRTGRLPSVHEVAAIMACAAAVLLRVLATCMTLAVTRPHRADLRGPRDTPAPPGVMAAYSVRLAVSTTLVAVVFAGLAEVATWQWSVLVALPLVLLSLRRLVRAASAWSVPATQARVASVVASG